MFYINESNGPLMEHLVLTGDEFTCEYHSVLEIKKSGL